MLPVLVGSATVNKEQNSYSSYIHYLKDVEEQAVYGSVAGQEAVEAHAV